ncbi:MAG: DUF481 domain-containing protein, partial [Bacteriovoracaceae bacterium]|nr:DUF481 domain-containing protein [Bacteriovoracaceae bacterium]
MIKLILSTTLIISTTTLWASKVENFSHRSELAIVSTGGNSKVETYNAKTESTYEVGKRSYTAGGHYTLGLQGADDGDMQESARNWDAKVKYEQALRRNFNATAAIQFEGDEFSGYEQRENHDLGGKYIFVDTDKKSLHFEAA